MQQLFAVALTVLLLIMPVQKHSKQKIKPLSFSDFNACVQNTNCGLNCWFHTVAGNYNLTSQTETIKVGTGVISYDRFGDFYLIDDQTPNYLLTIHVKAESGDAKIKLEDYEHSITTEYTGQKLTACTCEE